MNFICHNFQPLKKLSNCFSFLNMPTCSTAENLRLNPKFADKKGWWQIERGIEVCLGLHIHIGFNKRSKMDQPKSSIKT